MATDSHVFNEQAIDRIARRSRWAALLSLLGAGLVIASFAVSIAKLRSLREKTAAAQTELDKTSNQLQQKEAELTKASKQLEQINSQLKFRQSVYSQLMAKNQIPAAALSAAADNAIQSDPKFAQQVEPSVVIHIAHENQRPKAKELEERLEHLGYQVPGIEFVGAKAPNACQVRYFFKSDQGPDLEKIRQVMQQSGVSAQGEFIGLKTVPPSLRPKLYEIWLGQKYVPQ